MADPYLKQFKTRLRRIDRIQRRGGGFEATGTLGQSHYTRMRRRSGRPVLLPALIIVAALISFKAVSAASLGSEAYLARVVELGSGTPGERVVAFLMAPDPISKLAAGWLAPLI